MSFHPRTSVSHEGGWSLLSLVLILTTAFGCVTGTAAPEAPGSAPTSDRTASGWQERMVKILVDDPAGYKEAWGLFSSGGWSDAGQILVTGDRQKNNFHVFIAAPNESAWSSDRAVSAAVFTATLDRELKAAESLKDLDSKAFDALTYEYLHAVKTGDGKVVIEKRLVIRNTGTKKAPAHDALVAAFQALKAKS